MLSFGLDQVQPWPPLLSLSITSPPCTISPTCQALEMVHFDPDTTMPALLSPTMPSPSPFTSAEPPHVSELAQTLLMLTMHALDRDGVDTAQATRAQTRPRHPEHARTCPWTRQDAAVPRRLSSPLPLSLHLHDPRDLTELPDKPTWPRERCGRRHRRRDPPRCCRSRQARRRIRPPFAVPRTA